ncbi:MAG: LysR family transcriptional regulator [Candidatus Riflebacteria bacterium]|nr:LysR family transcriptional regulator [Candidatus Riflebacteria bacterium]
MNKIHLKKWENIDIPQLRPFFMVAQTGSFSLAADRLFVSQSAVSHAICKLEETLGTSLFERGSKKNSLTDDGKQLFEACERVFYSLAEVTESIQMRQGKEKGYLRLGATVEFGCTVLMKHIKPFMDAHPEIEIDFFMRHDLISPLQRDDLDLIIDCVEHRQKGLLRLPLFREKYVLVVSPSFRNSRQWKNPRVLENLLVLSLDKKGQWWEHFLLSIPAEKRPYLWRFTAINHVRGMITAAVQGMGVALLPKYSVMHELRDGLLEIVFPKLALPEDCFCVYQKEEKAKMKKQRMLTDFLSRIKLSEFGD